jgi:hypothetical protein
LKIINSIRAKVIKRLSSEIGPQYSKEIHAALAQGGALDDHLMQMVENEHIDLVDEQRTPLLKKQTTLISSEAPNADTGAEAYGDAVNIRVDSPTAKMLDDAELQVKQQSYSELQNQVVDYVRRNSLLKEAQDLRV